MHLQTNASGQCGGSNHNDTTEIVSMAPRPCLNHKYGSVFGDEPGAVKIRGWCDFYAIGQNKPPNSHWREFGRLATLLLW